MPSPVYTKRRKLVNQSVPATVNLPVWDPDGDPLVYIGDFKGAIIGGFDWVLTDKAGGGTLDGVWQHSDDLSIWADIDATNLSFTQATGDTSETLDVPDDTFIKRHIRLKLTKGTTLVQTVVASVYFKQPFCKGTLAPPGRPAINH
jgi:hypothetical protein